ncbi:spermidine synthase [Agreia sp. COWG]|uniref:spermidine synthase n=1 Tax=Agreia sp. COWG TaxID=2773266 RepID=UPI001927EE4C|nr:fused MFS/spermidine synthase [Agreia sp. COWG]
MTAPTTTRLPSGSVAELSPDPFVAGALTLSIDGVPQSHLSVRNPRDLFYDYVRRMGTVVDTVAPVGAPIGIVHLGAGALTLARYVAETRPGSRQLVVEYEVGLVSFVLAAAPLPRAATVSLIEADALDALRTAHTTIDDRVWAAGAHVVVCDLYAGLETPPHLTTSQFYECVDRVLSPGGVALVNVADDAGLAHTTVQAAALGAVFPVVALLGPSAVLDGSEGGNVVLVAGHDAAIYDRMPALAAAGPHPAAWRVAAVPGGTLPGAWG